MDRDGKFCEAFRSILKQGGVDPVRLPPHAPNLNAIADRFVRSVRSECVDRMIFFGETMLRHVLRSYIDHYHQERNHQGLDNRLIEPVPQVGDAAGAIECREQLGGLLRYYYRKAAWPNVPDARIRTWPPRRALRGSPNHSVRRRASPDFGPPPRALQRVNSAEFRDPFAAQLPTFQKTDVRPTFCTIRHPLR